MTPAGPSEGWPGDAKAKCEMAVGTCFRQVDGRQQCKRRADQSTFWKVSVRVCECQGFGEAPSGPTLSTR